MSLLAEIIGEFFVQIVWNKIIRPVFFFAGVGLRLVFNFNRMTYAEIYRKDNNSIIGYLFLIVAIVMFFFIKAKLQYGQATV